MRTPFNISQEVSSPIQVSINNNANYHGEIDPSFILDDGSITEITQFTDLMCKSNITTEIYVVSKTFPHRGYSVTQNFRRIHHDGTGLETYARGECIEYTSPEFSESTQQQQSQEPKDGFSLEETLATFHIQRQMTSRILFLSKNLKQRREVIFPSAKKFKTDDCL